MLIQNVASIYQNRSYYTVVRNIDMLDSKLTNISTLIKHIYTSFDQVEHAAEERKSNDERISQWRKNVASFEPIILVLDKAKQTTFIV